MFLDTASTFREPRRHASGHPGRVHDALGRHPGIGLGDEFATRCTALHLAEPAARRSSEQAHMSGVGPGDSLLEQAHRQCTFALLAGDTRAHEQRGRVKPLAGNAQEFLGERFGGGPQRARIRGSSRCRHGAAALALEHVSCNVLDPGQKRCSDRRPGRLRSLPGGRAVALVQVDVRIALVVSQVLQVKALLAPLGDTLRGERPRVGRIVGGEPGDNPRVSPQG